MPAKRKPRPKREPLASTVDNFLGNMPGIWGVMTKFGMAGVVAGFGIYLLTVTIPQSQELFRDEMKAERTANREDMDKSREHGNKAATAIKGLEDAVREQTRLIDWHQSIVQSNQERIIKTSTKGEK